jgi:hypothetical protein
MIFRLKLRAAHIKLELHGAVSVLLSSVFLRLFGGVGFLTVAFSLLESMASAILVYTKILCMRDFVKKISFKLKENIDKKVDDELADMINVIIREGISDEKYQDLLKTVLRPENCSSLTRTKVN